MRRNPKRALAAIALGAVALGATAGCEPVPRPAPRPPDPGAPAWRLVGGDEFDGTALDRTRWRAYHDSYGDGNQQLGCNTPDNVVVSGGTLKLVARRQTVACPGTGSRRYTSAFLGSRDVGRWYPAFGRFEVRARLPHAQGLWPAFWLRHRSGSGAGEVDVVEYFHAQVPGRSTATLHLDGRPNVAKASRPFEAPTATPGWHTWAVEIVPEGASVRFRFLLDGVEHLTYLDRQHRWTAADPRSTWDLALDLAVGGAWVGEPDGTLGLLPLVGRCAQAGTPPGGCRTTGIRRVAWADPRATTFEVDWVRVWVPA